MIARALTEICHPKQWRTIPAKNLLPEGYPVFGANGIIGYWSEYNHESETITIACRGTCGSVRIADAKSYINGNAMCLDDLSDEVHIKYLYYYLVGYDFSDVITGTTIPQITIEGLRKVIVRIPSLEKQREIIDVLDKVDQMIQTRQRQLRALDTLIKARFVEKFGDPVLNQKGFPVYRMDEVVVFQGGSQPDKKYFEYEPSPDNVRLIQIRDYKTDNYITYIPKFMAKRFCTAEDIMIGRYGPPIFQILQGIEGSFNVALMKATPILGNREFIRWFLKQDCLLHYLEGLSKRTAGQDGIQMDKLKAYPVPLPPIEMQDEFEAFAKQVDKSKIVVQQALEKAQLLFDSLMQQYFG